MKEINKWKNFEMIDKYFPKGDRRRGEALVINAEAFFLGKNLERERVLKKWEGYYVQSYADLVEAWKGFMDELKKPTGSLEE